MKIVAINEFVGAQGLRYSGARLALVCDRPGIPPVVISERIDWSGTSAYRDVSWFVSGIPPEVLQDIRVDIEDQRKKALVITAMAFASPATEQKLA